MSRICLLIVVVSLMALLVLFPVGAQPGPPCPAYLYPASNGVTVACAPTPTLAASPASSVTSSPSLSPAASHTATPSPTPTPSTSAIVDPNSLSFTMEQGILPASQIVKVKTANAWTNDFGSVLVDGMWAWVFGVSPRSGTANSDLTVSIGTEGLGVGKYNSTLTIDTGNGKASIPMSLTVVAPAISPSASGAADFSIPEIHAKAPRPVGSYVVSVKGDSADPTAEVQAALDSIPASGGTVLLPQTITTTRRLVLSHSLTTIKCAGATCTLRHGAHFERENQRVDGMIETPMDAFGNTRQITDVSILGVTFDGAGYHPPGRPAGGLGAIGLFSVSRALISGCSFKGFYFDSISVLFGKPEADNVTIEKSTISGSGRNGLSLGNVQNAVLRLLWIKDSPSQLWAEAAGNGIDLEVEGNFPMRDVLAEDCIIERGNTKTAGDGVAIQPAYNSMTDIVLRRLFILDHQVGIALDGGSQANRAGVNNIERVLIDSNWIRADSNSHVAGGPFFFYGETPAGGRAVQFAKAVNNVFNGSDGPGPAQTLIADVRDLQILNTTYWGMFPSPYACAVQMRGAPSGVTLSGNRYSPECWLHPLGTNIRLADNSQLASNSADVTPPIVSFNSLPASIGAATAIGVKASDAGAGVARVWFFVDGIPQAVSDSAPYAFTLNPEDFSLGTHVVGARALDRAANLSPMIETNLNFNAPAKVPARAPVRRPRSVNQP